MRISIEEVSCSIHITSGTTVFFKTIDAGLLFFSRKAEEYIAYARIETVLFHDEVGERQRVIYNIIKSNIPYYVPNDVSDIMEETAESLVKKLSVSTKSIKRDLKRMKEFGIIKREYGHSGGHWEIIK